MVDSSEAELADAVCASSDPSRPVLTPGVDLLGELLAPGLHDRQWLAARDGQFIQLSELPYRICEQCTGTRSVDQIAAAVSTSTDLYVEPEQVAHIVQDKLIPTGLVCSGPAEGCDPRGQPGGPRAAWSRIASGPFLGAIHRLFGHLPRG